MIIPPKVEGEAVYAQVISLEKSRRNSFLDHKNGTGLDENMKDLEKYLKNIACQQIIDFFFVDKL